MQVHPASKLMTTILVNNQIVYRKERNRHSHHCVVVAFRLYHEMNAWYVVCSVMLQLIEWCTSSISWLWVVVWGSARLFCIRCQRNPQVPEITSQGLPDSLVEDTLQVPLRQCRTL